MFEVEKVTKNCYAVVDHRGDIVSPGYRNKKLVEGLVRGETFAVFNAAEDENDRRDYIKAYLAKRATRVYRPIAQMEFGF